MPRDLVAEDQGRPSMPERPQDQVAIVGMAVNMPGAPNTSRLWEVLEKGLNMVSEVKISHLRGCRSDLIIGTFGSFSGR
jgi:acyl transferase domain-containing protein